MQRHMKGPANSVSPTSGCPEIPSSCRLRLSRLPCARFLFAVAILVASCLSYSSPAHAQTSEDIANLFERILDTDREPQDIRIFLALLRAPDLKKLSHRTEQEIQKVFLHGIDLNMALQEADSDQQKSIRQQLVANSEITFELLAKYRRILNAWSDRGGDPNEIHPHRRYLWNLASDLTRTTELRTLVLFFKDWLFSPSGGVRVAFDILVFIASIIGLFAVSAAARRYAARKIDRSGNASALLKSFIAQLAFWMTLVIGLLVMLSVSGVRISPALAIFGGISFILGFALQDTIGNAVSGLMIMLNKPFDLGDFVRIGNEAGSVNSMSIMSTKIRTPDNQIIQIPNSKVWSDVIANASASDTRRVDLVFGISYSDDVDRAIELLKKLVDGHPGCLKSPKADVFLGELGQHAVNLYCRPWVATPDYWRVYWELTAAAKKAFDSSGISIPFPQVEVHVTPAEGNSIPGA